MYFLALFFLTNLLTAKELTNQSDYFSYGMTNSINFFNGNLYCATGNGYNGGLYKLENEKWKLVVIPELLSNYIRKLLPMENYLIVSTDKGIFGIDKNDSLLDLNEGLPSEVYFENTKGVLKVVESEKQLFLTLDLREIYYSNKDSISWKKANINFNRYIYDFDYFQGNLYLSIDREGVIKYNTENHTYNRITHFDNEFIFNINSTDKFLHCSSGFENYITYDGDSWRNFNERFDLNTEIIRKLIEKDGTIYMTDNINLYFSSNEGEDWNFINIISQVKKSIFTQELFVNDGIVYISVDDFGIIKVEESNVEFMENNVYNYKVEKIRNFDDITYYYISTLNYSFIYKNVGNNPVLIYDKVFDIVKDFYQSNNGNMLIMNELGGLIYSKNNTIWDIIKLPNNYDYNNHQVLYYDDYIMLTNADFNKNSLYTTNYGESWEVVEIMSNYEIIKIIDSPQLSYAISENKLFEFNKNNKSWREIYSSNNITDVLFDDGLYIIKNGDILEIIDNSFNKLSNTISAKTLISRYIAYFYDNTIKQFINNNWLTIFEFNYLKENQITDFNKISDNHLELGTNYLGMFDIFIDYNNIGHLDKNNRIKYENNVYFSDLPFDLKVVDLMGNKVIEKNEILSFDISEIKLQKYLIILQQDNNIYVNKRIK